MQRLLDAAQTRFEGRVTVGGDDSTLDDATRRLAKKNPERYAKFLISANPPPEDLAYLLMWYEELRDGMSRGWYFEPLSHMEIMAYKSLHDLPMDSFDVTVLRRLDQVWRKAQPKPKGAEAAERRR